MGGAATSGEDPRSPLEEEEAARRELEQAADAAALERIRVKYLGRKGILSRKLRTIAGLPLQERREIGSAWNRFRENLEEALKARKAALQRTAAPAEVRDVTVPGEEVPAGLRHPVSRTMEEIAEIFRRFGFETREGPEVEDDFHNFGALNIPPDHPARDLQDTFYLQRPEGLLLRTHTSPVQIRVMRSERPPLRILAPGRVYRRENIDATHSCVFHQVEGLAVDSDISFAELKAVLFAFVREMFGAKTKARLRPSYFPFVEPGAELDVGCVKCGGRGGECPMCKGTGFLELAGAGMVHPSVFRACGVDAKKWRGYAFGMGVERIAMLRWEIDDMRLFFENDLRFLAQVG